MFCFFFDICLYNEINDLKYGSFIRCFISIIRVLEFKEKKYEVYLGLYVNIFIFMGMSI